MQRRLLGLWLAGTLVCAASGCSGNSSDDGATNAVGAAGSAAMTGLPQLEAPADVAAPPADAMVTASGLASKVLVAGTGKRFPRATDTVLVNYTGWQTDGTRFDSSVARGMPLQFALNGVIAGWTEGLQLMVEGEERRLWIPENLAYGGRSKPYGMLVFDVQLLQIVTPP
jgi:FKBP-type peptidyl-prolyl cis-trans isomerase